MSNLLSDERLVRRAAGGEERAFAAIFERYHQPLYRYCAAIVGDSQDAQDALQNTMLKVLRALPGEAREIKLKPWLYRIAHNESIDLLRRRRDTRELGAELVAPGPPLAEELSARERLRQLFSDLDELPERQRGALVMRELAGLDFAGIATALGTSPAVARQTLYEARLSLHQMDEGRGMDCTTVTQALSDGDGRVIRRRDVRAHLRACSECRRFRAEIEDRERNLAALAPLPAVAAAGLLQGLLGGGAAGGGGGSAAGAAVAAGGAAKTLGSSAALKGAAAVLAIAAIGTGAAERGGLIDLGLPGGGGDSKAQSSQSAPPSSSHAGSPVAPAEAKHATGDAPTGAGQWGGTAHSPGPTDSPPQQSVSQPISGETRAATKQASAQPTSAAAPPAAGNEHASVPGHGSGAEAKAPASPQGKASGHPHGKGHEKQLPAAAAHGQETAAAHKNAEHGASGEPPGQASKPAHPEHPAHPNGGREKEPASESSAAEGTTAAEDTPSQHGAGQKP